MIHDNWIIGPSEFRQIPKALDVLLDLFDRSNQHIGDMATRYDTVYNLRTAFYYLKKAIFYLSRTFPPCSDKSLQRFLKRDFSADIMRVESERDMPELPF